MISPQSVIFENEIEKDTKQFGNLTFKQGFFIIIFF